MKNYYMQRSKSRTVIIYVVIKGEKTTGKFCSFFYGYRHSVRLDILIQHYKIKTKKGREKNNFKRSKIVEI